MANYEAFDVDNFIKNKLLFLESDVVQTPGNGIKKYNFKGDQKQQSHQFSDGIGHEIRPSINAKI